MEGRYDYGSVIDNNESQNELREIGNKVRERQCLLISLVDYNLDCVDQVPSTRLESIH